MKILEYELWNGITITDLIKQSSVHFLSSAFVGLAVYYLTLTILQKSLTTKQTEDSYIRGISLSFALCFSVLVHLLIDYTIKGI